jgi:hypothetical protein
MTALLPSFLIDLAEPVSRVEKFLWKELAGDVFQEFGRALDAKARIREIAPASFELSLALRGETLKPYGPFKSNIHARRKAEEEYSAWIRKTAIIEGAAETT